MKLFLREILRAGIIICTLLLLTTTKTFATHAEGADLTYQSLGNSQYQVTFTFYRDCGGQAAPNTQQLNVASTTCNFSQNYTMERVPGTGQEVTPACSSTVTTCSGGSATGVQEWKYTILVTLPAQCPDWTFSTTVTARNNATTTILNPGARNLFVDAYLDNTAGENNSPTFTHIPVLFDCINQINNYNHGVIDTDGDSLVYSFIAPRSGANTNLPYRNGYSVTNPLSSSPPVSINATTGDISVTPTAQEVGVVAVLVQEFRDGQIIGSVMRDMQIYTTVCTNTLPSVSGVGGSNSFSVSSCVGAPICFELVSNDPDQNQQLTMTWNNGIPAASFSVAGTTHPVGHFCWTPTAADARIQPYTFTITVTDDACPYIGSQSYLYSIRVSNMVAQVTATPQVGCHGQHNGSAMAIATGFPPLQYVWTTPQGTILTTPSISHLTGGNYILNVIDGNGCVATENFTINEPAAVNVSVTGVNAGCGGGTTGSATAAVTGGTPPYNYLWTPGNQTGATAVNLPSDTYIVRVSDGNNCSVSSSVTIENVVPVDFHINSTPATCVANDGSVTVTHSGGTGSYSYVWTPDVTGNTTTSFANHLVTGNYSVVATDLGSGCSETLNEIVANAAGITASISNSNDVFCQSDENGSATVVAAGGQPPYIYLWPNGDTTATTDHLSAGTWLAMVEDYNGCRSYASVTIGYTFQSPPISLGDDTMPCIGSPMIINAGSGFASYLWSDNSTQSFLSVNTSGSYSVYVTDANGCQGFDAVNVQFTSCANYPVTPNLMHEVSAFPNPFADELTVLISGTNSCRIEISITDLVGNLVYTSTDVSKSKAAHKVVTPSLHAGAYVLRVSSQEFSHQQLIIKQ